MAAIVVWWITFLDILRFGRINTDGSYCYKAKDEKCYHKLKSRGATDKDFVDIESENESKLQEAVGFVSIVIDARHQNFQL